MDRTPDEVAYQLKAIADSAQNIIPAVTSSAANPGGSITFRYVDRSGQTRSATGTAHTAISPGNVQAMRTDDGQWIVLGAPTNPSREALHESRRRRPQGETLGKVKTLLLKGALFGGGNTLYIGGDRASPKKIFTFPAGFNFNSGLADAAWYLKNLGAGDRYLVSLCLDSPTEGNRFYVISSGRSWMIEESDPRLQVLQGVQTIVIIPGGLWYLDDGSRFVYLYDGEVYDSPQDIPGLTFNGVPLNADTKRGTTVWRTGDGSENLQYFFSDGTATSEITGPPYVGGDVGALEFSLISNVLYDTRLTQPRKAAISKWALPNGEESTLQSNYFPAPSGFYLLDRSFHP